MSQTAFETSSHTHIGEVLKKRRQEINLSLKEVENATSIRMNSLRAIEEGNISSISPVYAMGFVKQYANFLGLDGDAVVKQHAHMFPSPVSQEFSYGIGTVEHRGSPGKGIKWLPNAFWVGITFVMIISAWYLASFLELI
ncbi:MAG: helix-turn-helix domain-containing protein [Chlamydiales bacterium]|nr:helix-turn-helix domain-containing protein [Chlamydiales bacterium]NCF70507.1 helix-turn-helix domain-containing protein [Chlamydiales bacterium]